MVSEAVTSKLSAITKEESNKNRKDQNTAAGAYFLSLVDSAKLTKERGNNQSGVSNPSVSIQAILSGIKKKS